MARLVTYKCPDCRETFDFLHHPSDEPPPDRCTLCNAWMGDEPEKAPVLHLNYGKEKNRVVDQVYRRMETASAERAEDAADLTGASVAEMSAVKITNMKDNTRPGESSAMTVPENRVSSAAAQGAQNLSYQVGGNVVRPEFQNPQAAQWAGETREGPAALATRKVMDSMPHANIIAQATRAGSDGKRH